MKKKLRITLCLTLALLALSVVHAFAGTVAMQDGTQTFYIGEGNRLFSVNDPAPLTADPASSIVYAGGGIMVFENANAELMRLDLRARSAALRVAQISGDAVWSENDGVIYYVAQSAPNTLQKYDPLTGQGAIACDAGAPIEGIRASIGGLLVRIGASEKLYVPALQRLAVPHTSLVGKTLLAFGRNQAELDESGVLALSATGVNALAPIDRDVLSMAADLESLYYLKKNNAGCALYRYDALSAAQAELVASIPGRAVGLAVRNGAAYLVFIDGTIKQVSLADGALSTLSQTQPFIDPSIGIAGNLLLVYDEGAFAFSLPVAASGAAPSQTAKPTLRPTPVPTPTPVPAPTPETEASFRVLSLGARGESVRRLQARLRDLGYLTGSADGVYGEATQVAVTYLQSDMGYPQTGAAGPQLQYNLYHGDPPYYDPYLPLESGDSGIRVVRLQERLRELYYTKAPAGGHYQSQTLQAVKRFQEETGYKATGRITSAQLRKLYSVKAPEYSGYLDLARGDEAPAVRRLTLRLRKLGYYEGSVSSTYSKRTYQAVSLFQSFNGLLADGEATAELQENMIFSPHARPYEPTPTPIPTPGPEQVISNKEIKAMKNWMIRNLGEDFTKESAVLRLQTQLIDLGYMDDATGRTKVYDSDTFTAVSNFQMANAFEQTGIADTQTLEALFL